MGAALTGISGMFMNYLRSVFWLSGLLQGARSCGSRHGLASRLGRLGCSFSLFFNLLYSVVQKLFNKSEDLKRAQPVSWASLWRCGQLASAPCYLIFAFVS